MIFKFCMVYIFGAAAGVVAAMTPELLTAFGAQVVIIIAAVGAVIVNIITVRKIGKMKEIQDQNLAETKVISGHVNSAATAAAGEIAGLRKELGLMQTAAADKKEIAAVLAATAQSPSGAQSRFPFDAGAQITDKPKT